MPTDANRRGKFGNAFLAQCARNCTVWWIERLQCRVRNIQRASDFAGVYAAAGAGLAVGAAARAIVRTNQEGAVLKISGRPVGLMANADLSGLAIRHCPRSNPTGPRVTALLRSQ